MQSKNNTSWHVPILLLKEIAIEKHGTGWQTYLADHTPFKQSNISRMFALKYAPSLKNFIILAQALKVNFFFEDQESTTDLNQAFERAMEALGRRPDKLPRN